jgi:nucleoid-associated protein YgaU
MTARVDRRRALASLAAGAGTGYLLHRLGQDTAPPGWDAHAVVEWIEQQDTATLAIALARHAGLGAAAYLACISTLALAIDALRWPTDLLARCTPPMVRRAVGLGLAGALSVPSLAAATAAKSEVPVLVQVEPAPAPTVVPVDDTVEPPAVSAGWTVRPGDNFWVIARVVLERHGVAEPDDATIARYWRVLIDANRDRLVVPGNADLVFPGQQLVLPAAQ